jgi:hypothetical protein
MNFVTVDDFKGDTQLDGIHRNTKEKFEAVANDIEKFILRDLLGDWLYTQLIADLDVNGDPVTQKYIDLVNGKSYIAENGITRIYSGFKPFLTRMIFEHYVETNHFHQTTNASVTMDNDNSTTLPRNEMTKVKNRIFNDAVKYYNECYLFLYNQRTDYFTDNEYSNWLETSKRKTYKGKIIRKSYSNTYYKNNNK